MDSSRKDAHKLVIIRTGTMTISGGCGNTRFLSNQASEVGVGGWDDGVDFRSSSGRRRRGRWGK